jgi:hypothetical protein
MSRSLSPGDLDDRVAAEAVAEPAGYTAGRATPGGSGELVRLALPLVVS